jgi:hypothetical protein
MHALIAAVYSCTGQARCSKQGRQDVIKGRQKFVPTLAMHALMAAV